MSKLPTSSAPMKLLRKNARRPSFILFPDLSPRAHRFLVSSVHISPLHCWLPDLHPLWTCSLPTLLLAGSHEFTLHPWALAPDPGEAFDKCLLHQEQNRKFHNCHGLGAKVVRFQVRNGFEDINRQPSIYLLKPMGKANTGKLCKAL